MDRRKIAFEWLKINADALQGFGSMKKYAYFNKQYPGLYSQGGFRGLIDDINSGRVTDETIHGPTFKAVEGIKDAAPQIISRPAIQTQATNGTTYKVLIFSDCHGWLADLKALRVINKVLQKNHFDEVCINGDLVDMPYISRHTQRLFEDGILNGYSEVGEIEYTRDQILKPLRSSTGAKIRIRLGNHDERITKPHLLGDKQLQKLAILYKHFESTKLDEMLGISESDGYIYDPKDVHTYFDMFHLVHGLSLANNASEKNIQEYMGSGSSGHTHRLGVYVKTNKKAPYVWLQSGHTRIGEQVEYFPTGKIPNWQQGFNVVTFYKPGDEWRFHWECVQIIEGRCMYNGQLFEG